MSVYKFEQWFKDQGGGWDDVDPENAWNAAIDQVLKIIYYRMDDDERQRRIEELKS